jgi:serine/threonine-protein kinase RsbW
MKKPGADNEAQLRVRNGDLGGPVLARVVGMLAARAQCPVDRLEDALLLSDAVAAYAPSHSADGSLSVRVATADGTLSLEVGPLTRGGAQALLDAAVLPGIGNVFERVADGVRADSTAEGGEQVVIDMTFAS